MKSIYLNNSDGIPSRFEYENLSELSSELAARNITIGDEVEIGNWVEIGNLAKLGNDVEIGDGVDIGTGAKLGNGVMIGADCNIEH